MGKLGIVLFAVCILVAFYFLNSALQFIVLPPFFNGLDVPVKLVGTALLVVGGFLMMKFGKKKDDLSA